ncbi:hypothetical protein Y032_0285g1353 [Ancylostoma ceylanicum]|nr:hypothetical protein Y032_0285g1353 [Ancylostoma ceylanicum]
MQTGLLATIAVDLLISIALPILHRVSRHHVYVLLISIPSLLYGLLTVVFGFIVTDDEPINMCNPPSALVEKVKNPWYFVALAAGAVTVLSYVLAYVTLLYNHKRHANQPQDLARKSMRTLSIILLIFLFTRYTTTIGANVLNMANVNADAVALYQNYSVFMAMLCYSQNFYVTFWRSTEYRKYLWHQHMRLHNFLFGRCCPFTSTTRNVFSIPHTHCKSDHTSLTPI